MDSILMTCTICHCTSLMGKDPNSIDESKLFVCSLEYVKKYDLVIANLAL